MSNSFTQKPSEMDQFIDFFEEDLENVRRVLERCKEENLTVDFKIHPRAETCEESAQHSNIEINQIVKTLIFKTGKEFIAVLAPGDSRVDTDKVRELSGEDNIRMASPEEVEKETGYIVGGVSPFDLDIPVFMEKDLDKHDMVRPAAGSKVVGVEIPPKQLEKAVEAEKTKLI